MRNWGYGAPALTTVLPAAVTDGERVYANWLGATFAIELASGKTAWSSEPNVKSVVSQLRSNNGRTTLFSTNAGQFALCLGQEGPGKGIVLSVSPNPNQSNRFHIVAHHAATGNVLWTTDQSNSDLGHASFIGTPLVDGNSVFALSHEVAAENPQGRIRNNGATAGQMVLRRLDLQTGTEIWSPLPLGTPQFVGDPDWGQQSLPIPSLVMSGGRLYVLTNDGALLAVNVGRHQIEWAYKYEPPASSGNRQRFFNPTSATGRHLRSTGPIVVRDGVVYFKESTSPTLYALEESGPHLRWKWQDSEFANLIGVDNSDAYLFSNELSAINRTQPETRWSNRLTVDLQGVGAQIGSRGRAGLHAAGTVRALQGNRRRAPHFPRCRPGSGRRIRVGGGKADRLRVQPRGDRLSRGSGQMTQHRRSDSTAIQPVTRQPGNESCVPTFLHTPSSCRCCWRSAHF